MSKWIRIVYQLRLNVNIYNIVPFQSSVQTNTNHLLLFEAINTKVSNIILEPFFRQKQMDLSRVLFVKLMTVPSLELFIGRTINKL